MTMQNCASLSQDDKSMISDGKYSLSGSSNNQNSQNKGAPIWEKFNCVEEEEYKHSESPNYQNSTPKIIKKITKSTDDGEIEAVI